MINLEVNSKSIIFDPLLANNGIPLVLIEASEETLLTETTEKGSLDLNVNRKGPSPELLSSPLTLSANDPHFLYPQLTGKYQVGVQSFYADPEERLLIDVHYPGIVGQEGPKYRILPLSPENHPMNTDGMEKVQRDRLENLWTRSQPRLKPVEGNFPVVLFSHGMAYSHSDYQHLVEDLTSHGYYVITISHPASNAVSVFGTSKPPEPAQDADKLTLAKAKDEAMQKRDDLAMLAMYEQVNDISFLIHQIRNGSYNELIGTNINVDQIGVMGHSLGGDTALKACCEDMENLIRTGIDLDGGALKHFETVSTQKPFLTIGAENGTYSEGPMVEGGEVILKDGEKIWEGKKIIWEGRKEWDAFKMNSPQVKLCIISQATHDDFSVKPWFNAIKNELEATKVDDCNVKKKTYPEIYREIRTPIVDWFNKYLRDS